MLQFVDTYQAIVDAQRDNATDIGVPKSRLSSNKLRLSEEKFFFWDNSCFDINCFRCPAGMLPLADAYRNLKASKVKSTFLSLFLNIFA